MKATRDDALLITLSAAFVALGGFLLLYGETRLGIATLVMFGSALGLFVSAVVTRGTQQRGLAMPGTVEAVGGVRIPVRKLRLVGGFGLVTLIGGTFAWAFGQDGFFPLALGGLLAVGGVVGIAAVATGLFGVGWLRFTPDGLEVGTRTYRYLVPWGDIRGVQVGSFQRNAAVLVHLSALDGVLRTVDPPAAAPRVATALAGGTVLVMTGQFGLDAAWLGRALTRYATEPPARAELAGPRAAIEGGD